MPQPVTAWVANSLLSSKDLNVALYTADGSLNEATGILFLAQRPIMYQAMVQGLSWTTSTTGIRHVLTGSQGQGQMVVDTAGYYGRWTDAAGGLTDYRYNAAVVGSSGTMPTLNSATPTLTAGGWVWLAHYIALNPAATGELAGADMNTSAGSLNAGARVRVDPSRDVCPFYLDLQNTNPSGTAPTIFEPAFSAWDSGNANWTNVAGLNDGSGENTRFFAWWAGAASGAYGTAATPALVTPNPYTPSSTLTSAAFNANVTNTLNFLSYPPMFRIGTTTSNTFGNATPTIYNFTTTTPSIDNFGGWTGGTTSTYTVQRAGVYLVNGLVTWAANTAGRRLCGFKVNSTFYWGPGYPASQVDGTYAAKAQILSLNVGDTVSLAGWQDSGGILGTATSDESRFALSWLCAQAGTATTWAVPDVSFRWAAGTPGSQLPALFNSHVVNDVNFLARPPYLLAYQTTAQSGIAAGVWTKVTMDTISGIVHADTGDPYGGWDATNHWYTAQRSGWYLVVAEVIGTASPVATSAFAAGLQVNTSGGVTPTNTPDWYEHMFASGNSNAPPGGTAVGLYYLAAGEHVFPLLVTQDYGATSGTTTGTTSGGTLTSHMEVIWISE